MSFALAALILLAALLAGGGEPGIVRGASAALLPCKRMAGYASRALSK